MEEKDFLDTEEIFSKVLRAGRRTYFFDVRATRANDYYLTITERSLHTMMALFITRNTKFIFTKKILNCSKIF